MENIVEVDLSKYNLGARLHVLKEKAPEVFCMLSSETRKRMSTIIEDAVRMELENATVHSLYMSAVMEARKMNSVLLTSMVDRVTIGGGQVGIAMMPAATPLVGDNEIGFDVDALIDVVVKEDQQNVVDSIQKHFPKKEVIVAPAVDIPKVQQYPKGVIIAGTPVDTKLMQQTSLVVTTSKLVAHLPLFMGEPIVTADLLPVFKAVDSPVENVLRREVLAANILADIMKIKRNKLICKPLLSSPMMVIPDPIQQAIKNLFTVSLTVFGAGIASANIGSVKGRAFVDFIYRTLIAYRNTPAYITFMNKIQQFMDAKPNVQLPTKKGAYESNTLEYAREVLSATRAIRGSDDRDSTAAGIASYLPFNANRSFVKSIARAKDVMQILNVCASQEVSFVGEGARAFVESLFMIQAKLNYVGMPGARSMGWPVVKGGGWKHQSSKFVLGEELRGLIIDTSYTPGAEIMTVKDYPVSKNVRIIDWPRDYLDKHFLPSCLLHNMVGYLLPKQHTFKFPPLVTTSIKCNLLRTVGSFYHTQRAFDVIAKEAPFFKLEPKLYRRFMEGMQVNSLQFIQAASDMDLSSLFAEAVGSEEAVSEMMAKVNLDKPKPHADHFNVMDDAAGGGAGVGGEDLCDFDVI